MVMSAGKQTKFTSAGLLQRVNHKRVYHLVARSGFAAAQGSPVPAIESALQGQGCRQRQ